MDWPKIRFEDLGFVEDLLVTEEEKTVDKEEQKQFIQQKYFRKV